jgi:hypothetical protein
MTLIDDLKNKMKIPSIEYADEKFNELKEQFIEMGQLKSDFDIEKFTVRKEGKFIAHNFHFLMRQYHLALYEMRRMLIDKEEKLRLISQVEQRIKDGEKEIIIKTAEGEIPKFTDLYSKQLHNELDLLEITMTNKIVMCARFEEMRNKLIEINGGVAPTNEQYQKEEPMYWKQFLENKAKEQASERATGISAGIWESIRMLEEEPVINQEFKVKILDESGVLMLGDKKPLKEN